MPRSRPFVIGPTAGTTRATTGRARRDPGPLASASVSACAAANRQPRGSGRRSRSASASIRSVSASTYPEPPRGSATLDDAGLVHEHLLGAERDLGRLLASAARGSRPARWCAASWCRRAPPRGPRYRCVRRCCTAAGPSDDPGRLGVERNHWAFADVRAVPSRIQRAQIRRAARNLAISSKKSTRASKKKRGPGAKVSTSSPRDRPSST